jgi:hypothetical protein
MDEVIANKHVQVLIPLESNSRKAPRPGWNGGRYAWMRTCSPQSTAMSFTSSENR